MSSIEWRKRLQARKQIADVSNFVPQFDIGKLQPAAAADSNLSAAPVDDLTEVDDQVADAPIDTVEAAVEDGTLDAQALRVEDIAAALDGLSQDQYTEAMEDLRKSDPSMYAEVAAYLEQKWADEAIARDADIGMPAYDVSTQEIEDGTETNGDEGE